MVIGGRDFDENRTHIMGILNVTPDSFSDGGRYNNMDSALFHVQEMVKEGAEIIDVGGESTRPGFNEIETSTEIERVVPVICKIKSEFNIPVSIDTYRPETALEAIKAGADLLNDIKGHEIGGEYGRVAAESGLPICIMHNRNERNYKDFAKDYYSDCVEMYEGAVAKGVKPENIILDPGVGFAKDTAENLYVMRHMDDLKDICPRILLGCSNKSVIGNTLDLPVEERLEGTIATTVWAGLHNIMFARVHNVKANLRALRMAEAINNA
ncbi:MAG: dihydropteroate synthase [Lachnospiraceae bacterium]|nr:dihydropteroate synthase [Lachnospiraceae bacterium]